MVARSARPGRPAARPRDKDRPVTSFGRPVSSVILAAIVLALTIAVEMQRGAQAQGRLESRYIVTLGGIKIGQGSWVIDVGDDQYTAAASGVTAGLARVFSSGHGTGASRGAVKNGDLVSASYATTMTTGRRTDDVRITLNRGHVKNFEVNPPTPEVSNRVPVTDAHRRNVTDPMTASLVRVSNSGDLLAPEICQRHIPIFDGRMRYDLNFAFKRMEKVRAKGYEGPALVCAIYFSPLAGHIPDRAAIKYLVEQRDMEVWLAPIAGTRVLVPIKVSIPTPLGTGVLVATDFNSAPQPARASARTQ
jgi:hypothetical protein